MAVCFRVVSWSRCRTRCPHSSTCYHHFSYSPCTHFSHFWHRPTLGQYASLKGTWGRSIRKRGHSDPLKRDFSDFFLWEAEYSMDFNQIWYRHPLWAPTLSLLVWKSKGQSHAAIFCIFLCLFISKFAILWKKRWFSTNANIPYVPMLLWRSNGHFCTFLLYFSIVMISNISKYGLFLQSKHYLWDPV